MENMRKLSFNYHQIPFSQLNISSLNPHLLNVFLQFSCDIFFVLDCNDDNYSDIQIWVNSVDSDLTAPEAV